MTTTTQPITGETEESFEDFYNRHVGLVRHVLGRFSPQSNREVEDLTQVTFINAWRAGNYQQVPSQKNWIALVAKNVARDFHRLKRVQEEPDELDNMTMEYTPIDEQTSRSLEWIDCSDTLLSAYQTLDQNDQVIIGLLLLDFKRREIQAELGLDKMQTHRAIEHARRNFVRAYQGDVRGKRKA